MNSRIETLITGQTWQSNQDIIHDRVTEALKIDHGRHPVCLAWFNAKGFPNDHHYLSELRKALADLLYIKLFFRLMHGERMTLSNLQRSIKDKMLVLLGDAEHCHDLLAFDASRFPVVTLNGNALQLLQSIVDDIELCAAIEADDDEQDTFTF